MDTAVKTAKEEIAELVLQNYKEITGKEPVLLEDYEYHDYTIFGRDVLVAIADPEKKKPFAIFAFVDEHLNLVGIKTDPIFDGIIGAADKPLNDGQKDLLKKEMVRLIPVMN